MNKLYIIRGYWNEIHLNYFPFVSTSSNKLIEIVNQNKYKFKENNVDYVKYDIFCIENTYNHKEMKILQELSKFSLPEIQIFSKKIDDHFLITPLFVIKNFVKDKTITNFDFIGQLSDSKFLINDSLIFLEDLKQDIQKYENLNLDIPLYKFLNLTKKQFKYLMKYKYIDTNN
jgi:hypothetical protein